MTLTKYEKETIILFNEGEDTAHIQTYNAGLRKRLAAFSKKHPDLCRLEKSFAQGGVIYVLDKSRLSIRLQAPYSAPVEKWGALLVLWGAFDMTRIILCQPNWLNFSSVLQSTGCRIPSGALV